SLEIPVFLEGQRLWRVAHRRRNRQRGSRSDGYAFQTAAAGKALLAAESEKGRSVMRLLVESARKSRNERGLMFGRSRTQMVKENASATADLAAVLVQDKKFRKQLLAGVGHGVRAKQRATARIGIIAALGRLAA